MIGVTKYKLFAFKDRVLVAKAITENETQICKLADELRKNGYMVRLYDIVPTCTGR